MMVMFSVVRWMLVVGAVVLAPAALAAPNIVLIYADDISARELPVYGSNVWTDPMGRDTKDQKYRAQTPVLDRLAEEGAWVRTMWAATICSPSRATMMTGRYAHRHKWWHNDELGVEVLKGGHTRVWPFYESSPRGIGQVAQEGGYATCWVGKTQMKRADMTRYGFEEGFFTPGEPYPGRSPYTDLAVERQPKPGGKGNQVVNVDTGEVVDYYPITSWLWKPSAAVMDASTRNRPGGVAWWPRDDAEAAKVNHGLNTYGPDVELDYIFDFMERQKAADKPFFIYHTTHLGHGHFDFLNVSGGSPWPGTPVLRWDGQTYHRTEPAITGDAGQYDTHGTVTDPGIHHHVNYLDYQVSLYLKKFKELGVENDTVLVFCADNGSSGYGKGSPDRQKGTHVPMIVYAPGQGWVREGEQDVLSDVSDLLPTIAELAGVELPADYEVNGQSLLPFLRGQSETHRSYIYGFRRDQQLIRGTRVMKDGKERWWDVSSRPADLISFEEIKDWDAVSSAHRAERDRLQAVLPRFSRESTTRDAPRGRAGR